MLYVEHKKAMNGVAARMLRGGMGDTVLFLHGAGGLSGWLDYFDKLANCFDLVAPEHPGFGKSERPEWIASIGDLAHYYRRFSVDLGRIHLIGSSLGGWLASELAVLIPEAIRSLTLIGPAGMRAIDNGSGPGAVHTRAERVRQFYFDQSIAERVLATDPPDIEQTDSRNWRVARLLGGPGFHNPAMQGLLAKVSCPTQILWGEEDRVVSVAQADVWRNAIAGAELHVFPRCGHLPHVERSNEAADLTKEFIQRATRTLA